MSVHNAILIVDDEEILLETISFNLKKAGFETLKASDGESGLALALETNPQLIILDLMLPRLSGWDVCRTLRQSPQFRRDTPILMLTARSGSSIKRRSLEAGANDYLLKPFAMRELLERVQTLLSPPS